jgi:uncharacterized peroxidase-related enzyme
MPFVTPLPVGINQEVGDLARFFNITLGFPPNSILTMQRRPEIASAFIALNKAVMMNHGHLTDELKRLIALVSSQAAGCNYCQAHTALAAKRFGATDARLAEVWTFQSSDLFAPAEKVAFELAIAATQQPSDVDPALMERVRSHFDDGDIVELMGVISLFGFLNRWNDGMGTVLEAGAVEAGRAHVAPLGWSVGKHVE